MYGQYTNSTLYTVNNTRTVHKITFNTTIFLRRVIEFFFYLNSKNPNNTESTENQNYSVINSYCQFWLLFILFILIINKITILRTKLFMRVWIDLSSVRRSSTLLSNSRNMYFKEKCILKIFRRNVLMKKMYFKDIWKKCTLKKMYFKDS